MIGVNKYVFLYDALGSLSSVAEEIYDTVDGVDSQSSWGRTLNKI